MPKASRGQKSSGGRAKQTTNFTTNQGEAIEHYASGDGMWINQYFRNDGNGFGELSSNEKEYVKDLDSALNKTVKDKELYRSVDAKVIFGDIDYYNLEAAVLYGAKDKFSQSALNKAQSLIGTTKTEKGYMSTTRDRNIAEGFGGFTGADNPIVMRITPSKTTKGADISKATKRIADIEKSDPQKETLLARNQKYKINKVYGKNGNIYVDVSMA